MPILYNVGNKLTAGSEPPQLYRYQDRVLVDGGTLETRDEASTFVRRLRSAGVLGSTVLAGVAGGVKAGTLYSIIGPDLDVTRGTVKNRVNRAGVLSEVASGVPATDFVGGVLRGTTVEPSSRNEIRNNTMQGAVVGSPGTLPTNTIEGTSGLTREILDVNVVNGVQTIGIRYTGTASGTLLSIQFELNTIIAASTSQTWTGSKYISVSGTTLPNSYGLRFSENRLNGTRLQSGFLSISPNNLLQRFEQTRTLINSEVERISQLFECNLTNGQSYDFTIRIGLPQMELGSVATSVIKTTGTAQTRNADVITKTGLGSVLPQTEGWVYAEVLLTHAVFAKATVAITDGSVNNRLTASFASATQLTLTNRIGGSNFDVSVTIPAIPVSGGVYKVLLRFAPANYSVVVNGVVYPFITSAGVPPTNTFVLGQNGFGSNFLNDPIHSYAIGSGPITDAQAIQLTTL
jgi:hypothetical protein